MYRKDSFRKLNDKGAILVIYITFVFSEAVFTLSPYCFGNQKRKHVKMLLLEDVRVLQAGRVRKCTIPVPSLPAPQQSSAFAATPLFL